MREKIASPLLGNRPWVVHHGVHRTIRLPEVGPLGRREPPPRFLPALGLPQLNIFEDSIERMRLVKNM